MSSSSDGLREHWGSSCGSIPLGFGGLVHSTLEHVYGCSSSEPRLKKEEMKINDFFIQITDKVQTRLPKIQIKNGWIEWY